MDGAWSPMTGPGATPWVPRSETGWVTGGVGRFVGAAGGTAEPYIFTLSPDSAFPLAPDTKFGMLIGGV